MRMTTSLFNQRAAQEQTRFRNTPRLRNRRSDWWLALRTTKVTDMSMRGKSAECLQIRVILYVSTRASTRPLTFF